MPRTRFDPSLDGFPTGFNAKITAQEAEQIQQILDQARQDALEQLRRAYFDGVQVFNLEHFLNQWINRWGSSDGIQTAGCQAGMLFAMLDHFQTALPLPERSTLESQEFLTYLQSRNLDNLRQNLSALMIAMCIYTLIPEDWVPSQAVSERIHRAVSAIKIVDKLQIELDLGLAPGGKHWLDEQTRLSLGEIQARIESGLPCPAWIIRSPESLLQHNQVIVYGYEEPTEDFTLLWVYDLDCSNDANQIRIDHKQDRLVLQESCEDLKPMTIQGLLLEEYSPAPPPEVSIPWWAELEFVRRLIWNSRHLWRGLQRRIRPEDDQPLK